MTLTLILEQTFNGLQAGVTLFLVAAGLTLILGIMDFVFLAHGSRGGAENYITFWATDRVPKPPINWHQRAIKHR